jgi:dimeric dUTPase (all-alpha-NTP-PPase superfamily)
MNLKDLLQQQKALDELIVMNGQGAAMTEKGLLSARLLALQVEVSELANATRCFKYWSTKESEPKERLLDEYADVLHFVLSLGNTLKFTPEEIEQAYLAKHEVNYQRQKQGY